MSWDSVWEDVFQRQEWGRYPGEDLIRFVARNFYKAPDRREIKILELGCGPGGNLWYMAREGFSVYGIEGSKTASEKAQTRLDAECPGWSGKIAVGDFSKPLPFESGFFDAAIDNEAVYCNAFEISKSIYAECRRVLKPGGKVFSRTFASGSWGDGTGRNLGRGAWAVGEGPLLGKGYSRFTSKDEIPELFKGFEIAELELITRTSGGLERETREWLITAVKK